MLILNQISFLLPWRRVFIHAIDNRASGPEIMHGIFKISVVRCNTNA
jgi:hypothetical protein